MATLIARSRKYGDMEVIFDDKNLDKVNQYKYWYISKSKGFYAFAVTTKAKNRRKIYMHFGEFANLNIIPK